MTSVGSCRLKSLPIIMEAVSGKGKNLMYDGNVYGEKECVCNGGRKETEAVFEER